MVHSNSRYRVGELRPSQILFSYGIGAIADLPNLSVMIMGLEDWDTTYTVELSEERLLIAVQHKLGMQVKRLLFPPTPSEGESAATPKDEASRIGIPVAPFPSWMVCPRCRLLAPLHSGFFDLESNPYRFDRTYYVHKNCSKAQKPPKVIPARFLVACEQGHLDDFPWKYFVHRGHKDCNGALQLTEYGISGAATDIMVKCRTCRDSRRLSDAFGKLGKENLPRCRGRHPHLRQFDEHCDRQMKGILLGASNSWFAMTLSALSIPSSSDKLAQLVEQNAAVFAKASSVEVLEAIVSAMQSQGLLQEFSGYTPAEIWEAVQAGQRDRNRSTTLATDLKTPEWETFIQADPQKNAQDFQLRSVEPPTGYEAYFTQTVLVEKLREVRALIGFTRIQSPGDFVEIEQVPQQYRAPLSRSAPSWIPASEVKGEGIFLQFSEDAIAQWEQRPAVQQHDQDIQKAHHNWCLARDLDPAQIPRRSVRYVLIHSFSHALMRQFTLECGYNAASLRERLYTATSHEGKFQAGILIYTAAPDSEGTLGGLVSLGEPDTLGYHVAQALEQIRICASDPLCASHTPSDRAVSLHWASCHACSFVPETSCEQGNQYLNRSTLIPTLQGDRLAFFV